MEIALPGVLDRIASLPRDRRGYYVPWFVAWIDGEPDFRVVASGKINEALVRNLCWICGKTLGRYKAYVVGPIGGVVNRTSPEPPSHTDCADFAAQVCPHLVHPNAKYRESNMPDGLVSAPGTSAERRNPQIAIVWVIEGQVNLIEVEDGYLFSLDGPSEIRWYHRGRIKLT